MCPDSGGFLPVTDPRVEGRQELVGGTRKGLQGLPQRLEVGRAASQARTVRRIGRCDPSTVHLEKADIDPEGRCTAVGSASPVRHGPPSVR